MGQSSKISAIGVTLIAALIGGAFGARFGLSQTGPRTAAKEGGFERVMRTKVLRCGYIVYPPETIKDPNTGALSGTVVDTTEEVARQLGWTVEWTAEVGFQDKFEGLKTGRYDALCSGLREDPTFAKEALFTTPWVYGPSYAMVRADDTRFDATLEAANAPDIRIAQIDGEGAQIIARETFPKASAYALPPMSAISDVLESVATRKADIAFLQIAVARSYIQQHPGRLKILRARPARNWIQPLIALSPDDFRMKYAMDATIRTLQESGFIERTLRAYDPNMDSYLLPAKPYQLP